MRPTIILAVFLLPFSISLPVAHASEPSFPWVDAFDVAWPDEAPVGKTVALTVSVHAEEPLEGQIRVRLDLPSTLSSSDDLVWVPEAEQDAVVHHTWSLDVDEPGVWKLHVTAEIEEEGSTRTVRGFQAYGLSSNETPGGIVEHDLQSLVPKTLEPSAVSLENDTIAVQVTPSDWMAGGEVHLVRSPIDPWEDSLAVQVDGPPWSPVPVDGPFEVSTGSGDGGPSNVVLLWRSDSAVDIAAGCWTVDPLADPVGPYGCMERLPSAPDSTPLLLPAAGPALSIVALLGTLGLVRSRRP